MSLLSRFNFGYLSRPVFVLLMILLLYLGPFWAFLAVGVPGTLIFPFFIEFVLLGIIYDAAFSFPMEVWHFSGLVWVAGLFILFSVVRPYIRV